MIQKLIKIQEQLKATKDDFNSFGGYKYRSAEGILAELKPLAREQGVLITLTDVMVEVGGNRYIRATASATDGDNTIATDGWAREAVSKKGMDESQLTGTASSYARKYALCGLLAIGGDPDPDATNEHGSEANAKRSAKVYDTLKDKKSWLLGKCKDVYGVDEDEAIEMIKKAAGGVIKTDAQLAKAMISLDIKE